MLYVQLSRLFELCEAFGHWGETSSAIVLHPLVDSMSASAGGYTVTLWQGSATYCAKRPTSPHYQAADCTSENMSKLRMWAIHVWRYFCQVLKIVLFFCLMCHQQLGVACCSSLQVSNDITVCSSHNSHSPLVLNVSQVYPATLDILSEKKKKNHVGCIKVGHLMDRESPGIPSNGEFIYFW